MRRLSGDSGITTRASLGLYGYDSLGDTLSYVIGKYSPGSPVSVHIMFPDSNSSINATVTNGTIAIQAAAGELHISNEHFVANVIRAINGDPITIPGGTY